MTLTEMTKLLREMKADLKKFRRAVGDDMGCDGTRQDDDQRCRAIMFLEADIALARNERAKRKAMSGQLRRMGGKL